MHMRWLGSLLFGKLRSPRCFFDTARVVRAARREDWAGVVAGLDQVRRHRCLDGLELGYLGAALLRLERYEDIVEEFTALQKGFDKAGMEALRPYLASALLWLERNQEALEQFEKLGGSDDATRTHRALRQWNHAIALYRLGRKDEARVLLMNCIDDAWPQPEFGQALKLLRSMGIEAH